MTNQSGTMAGQIVMDGFLSPNYSMPPWARRLLTRSLAIIPAMIFAMLSPTSINDLLNFSQVILSIQLPFAVWPLVLFTSSSKIMTLSYIDDDGEGISPPS
jgi:manganese transport protein